jgi:hypothetical protein
VTEGRREQRLLVVFVSELFQLSQILAIARSISKALHRDEVLVAADPEFGSVCKCHGQSAGVELCVIEAADPREGVGGSGAITASVERDSMFMRATSPATQCRLGR